MRSHRALDHLSLEIPFGEVFGLFGPNGAGKSTALKLLLNLIRPTSGRVVVLGKAPGSVAARRRLGFLAENPTFYDHLTAEERLAYFAGLFGYRGETARRRASTAELVDPLGRKAWLRRPAARGLDQLAAIGELQKQLEAFTRAHQPPPASWADWNPAGPRNALPVDPAGVPYEFDAAAGRVVPSRHSPLYPLPSTLGAK
jgi:ABC-type sulfate/molybdate transport systems ATPase subunit